MATYRGLDPIVIIDADDNLVAHEFLLATLVSGIRISIR